MARMDRAEAKRGQEMLWTCMVRTSVTDWFGRRKVLAFMTEETEWRGGQLSA